jgi:hypothetical protein
MCGLAWWFVGDEDPGPDPGPFADRSDYLDSAIVFPEWPPVDWTVVGPVVFAAAVACALWLFVAYFVDAIGHRWLVVAALNTYVGVVVGIGLRLGAEDVGGANIGFGLLFFLFTPSILVFFVAALVWSVKAVPTRPSAPADVAQSTR